MSSWYCLVPTYVSPGGSGSNCSPFSLPKAISSISDVLSPIATSKSGSILKTSILEVELMRFGSVPALL